MVEAPIRAVGLDIRLFGPISVRLHGRPLPGLHSRKAYTLLALLILREGREVSRDWLAGMLWPESLQDRAYYNLRENLADLRKALGGAGERISSPSRRSLAFDPIGLSIDVLEFDQAIKRGGQQGLEYAVGLYNGPLMEGCSEESILTERSVREASYLQALKALSHAATSAGRHEAAAHYLVRCLAVDPIDEATLRRLLRAFVESGEHARMVEVYRSFRLRLHDELGIEPDEETISLFRQLRNESSSNRPSPTSVTAGTEFHQISCIARPPAESAVLRLEPAGGAVPLDSAFYIERPADFQLSASLERGDVIILVKGARQVGKTSLLARGLQQARISGLRVAMTDLQTLNDRHLESPDSFSLALAKTLALQLEAEQPGVRWDADLGPSLNLDWYLRDSILKAAPERLVWGLDEVDRLFGSAFGAEMFGLLRSWHNRRALDPGGPWSRLTIALGYATEAHLFIGDVNQSPFNVGTKLTLEDFDIEQVMELNIRHGSTLADEKELERFYELTGGHPYLVRKGLYELAASGRPLAELESTVSDDDGPYADHLRRMLLLVSQDAELYSAIINFIRGTSNLSSAQFYRLRSAGIVKGSSRAGAAIRCGLYHRYLLSHQP